MNSKDLYDYLEDYKQYKQSCGIKFEFGEYWIKRYIAFHVARYPDDDFPTKESVNAYEASITGKDKNGIVYLKGFCRYLKVIGQDVYVSTTTIVRESAELPYIITSEEGKRYFRTLDNMLYSKSDNWDGKGIILSAFFRMMWCCGTRTKETRILLCNNVNLEEGFVDVLDSKGHVDRRIFLTKELKEYYIKYNEEITKIRPKHKYFFPGGSDSGPIDEKTLCLNFKKVWFKAFPEFNKNVQVRPYDFRHHFVYENINRWLKDGKDVNVMIYYLKQVTGHKSLKELLYYFHLVPEIYNTIKEMASDLDEVYAKIYYAEDAVEE